MEINTIGKSHKVKDINKICNVVWTVMEIREMYWIYFSSFL